MNSIFEAYLKLSGYDVSRAEYLLKQIQNFGKDEFIDWQTKQKWKIARYHYENSSFYQQKVGNHFPENWEDLPVLQKSDFQDDLSSLLSKGYTRHNTYIANTSGSSGHPFYFAKNKAAHAMDWAVIKDRYNWHGLNISDKQARYYGIPLDQWSYRKEKIKDWIMNRVRFPIFDLSDETLEQHLSIFKEKKFTYAYGYTNALVMFARFLLKKQIKLTSVCPSLRICISTSEVLTLEDRTILKNAFGVDVINEYGASEVGLLAFETPENEWLLCEETLFIETTQIEQAELDEGEGNIVVTDLDNLAMPFIRYNIGDIGLLGKETVSGSNNRKLEKLSGRVNDTIKLPSGKVAPGLTFYYVSRSILESSNVLKEFIIRQTALDTFIFEIVSDRELNNNEIRGIQEKMDLYLETGLNLEIRRVSEIQRPPSGKIKHFYSELD
jgi:phenylacetate-CoA ligase